MSAQTTPNLPALVPVFGTPGNDTLAATAEGQHAGDDGCGKRADHHQNAEDDVNSRGDYNVIQDHSLVN